MRRGVIADWSRVGRDGRSVRHLITTTAKRSASTAATSPLVTNAVCDDGRRDYWSDHYCSSSATTPRRHHHGRRRVRRPAPRGHPAPALRVRPDRRSQPGPEQHRRSANGDDPQARRRRLDPAASRRTSARATARCRPSTSSTSTTGCGSTSRATDTTIPGFPERSSPPARRRRPSSCPPGYGYRTTTTDHWVINYMLHNLTSDARRRCGSPTTSTSSPRPRRPPRASSPARPVWMDVQNGSATRCSTCSRARARTARSPIPTTRPTRTTAAGEERVDRRPRRRAVATAGHLHPGRAARRPLAATREPVRPRTLVPSPDAQVLRARGRGVVGRLDDRHHPDWRVAVQKGDMLRSRPPTTRRGRRGTSRWGSWSCGWPTATGGADPFATTVDDAGRPHARAPARERQPRRHRTPTLADVTEAPARRRRPTRSTSPTSSTPRAT